MKLSTSKIFLLAVMAIFTLGGLSLLVHPVQDVNLLNAEASDREASINDALPGKELLLAPFQITSAALDKRYFPEDLTVTDDYGEIMRGNPPFEATPTEKNVNKLYQVCKEQGKNFLYVILPGKPLYDEEITSYGIPCTRNSGADKKKDAMQELGIPVLDLREPFREKFGDDPDRSAVFYKTDHHWNADSGLMASRLIAKDLNERFGMSLQTDNLDEEKLGREVYPDAFVGEMGMATLGKYGGRDDFIRRYPLYDTHFRFISPKQDTDETGGFEVFTDEAFLEERPVDYGNNLYYYYMFVNGSRDEIFNYDVSDGDILMIKESFSCVLSPFLALSCKHLTLWDMRMETNVISWIEEHPEIETVIIAYHTSAVGDSELNNFR